MTTTQSHDAHELVRVVSAATADLMQPQAFDLTKFKSGLKQARGQAQAFREFQREFAAQSALVKWLSDGPVKEELINALVASHTFAELTLQLQAITSACAVATHANTVKLDAQDREIQEHQKELSNLSREILGAIGRFDALFDGLQQGLAQQHQKFDSLCTELDSKLVRQHEVLASVEELERLKAHVLEMRTSNRWWRIISAAALSIAILATGFALFAR